MLSQQLSTEPKRMTREDITTSHVKNEAHALQAGARLFYLTLPAECIVFVSAIKTTYENSQRNGADQYFGIRGGRHDCGSFAK
jgi:hypothetical protein